MDTDDIANYAEALHVYYNLASHVDLHQLQRGARLAKDSRVFRSAGGENITETESFALNEELVPTLGAQKKELKVILLTCCVGAIVQGWSQSSITGANLQWPYEFGVQDDLWTIGGVNAVRHHPNK